jgi:hypothetical protein
MGFFLQMEYLPFVYPSLNEQNNSTRFFQRVVGFYFSANIITTLERDMYNNFTMLQNSLTYGQQPFGFFNCKRMLLHQNNL